MDSEEREKFCLRFTLRLSKQHEGSSKDAEVTLKVLLILKV